VRPPAKAAVIGVSGNAQMKEEFHEPHPSHIAGRRAPASPLRAGRDLSWQQPFILQRVSLKKRVVFTDEQLKLAATIVRNAGSYNLILAAGFILSAFPGNVGVAMDSPGVPAFRCFFLTGAVIAGVFGL
jgi:hypothetical protein